MFSFLEISLLSTAGVLLLLRVLPYWRLYRPLSAEAVCFS